jgi:hypothetical protein
VIVGSNLIPGIDVRFFSVFVFYSESSGFATSSHLPKEPYQQTNKQKTNKLRGSSPQENYTERAIAAGRQVSANFSG